MLKITVLGCAGSYGVPSLGSIGWGDCDSTDSRNQRLRASILIQHGDYNLLVDSGPDVRTQLVRAGINHIDAVFYTHEHADHTHGIDDIRGFTVKSRKSVPAYMDRKTFSEMNQRFGYLFVGNVVDQGDGAKIRKVGLEPTIIEPTGEIQIGPLAIKTFQQSHGRDNTSLGLRIGDFAYSTDASYLSKAAMAVLTGTKVWIVDCNNRTSNDSPKHSDLANTLRWINQIEPLQAFLTHLPAWWDYTALNDMCPNHVEPAYDGLKITLQHNI